ncbi:amino acid permease, partial [Streptomyces sp. SID5910]|nr:amino acid permease [Streptomyces sp. SID5910]
VLVYYAVANASAWTLESARTAARVVPAVGLAGCTVLAFSLPVVSVIAGVGVLAVGMVAYAVRGRPAAR